MKILVGCRLPEAALDELRSLGTEIVYEPDVTGEQLTKLISDAAILVVSRKRVSGEVIEAGKALQMIVQVGTDVSNIAIEEASAAGVFVSNCPDKDAIAIAEMTFGLLLALDREFIKHTLADPSEDLRKLGRTAALGLSGRTLGVYGFDTVQREIAKRGRAFGMKVLTWAPTLEPEKAERHGVEACAWPRELSRRSDMVAAYVPPQASDDVPIDAEFISDLHDGAYLTYIGPQAGLDETALAAAVRERDIRLAYDFPVVRSSGELVGKTKSILHNLPGVIGTRGLAHRTMQSWEAIAGEVVRVVRAFLVRGESLNCVNLLEHSPATWQLVLRLKDAVGVMAAIMDRIRTDGVNAEEISSRVFTGAQAAWCVISLDERPSAEGLAAIRDLDGVLHLELRALV